MMGVSLNWKLLAVFLSLVGISIFIISNTGLTNYYIRQFLEWKHLNISLWLFIGISFIVHYLSLKNIKHQRSGLIYTHFGKFADSGASIVTYGFAATTGASILKGVYIQKIVGSEVYFMHFDQIDISSMLIVSLFLFGYSLYATFDALSRAIIISKSSTAIPVSDNQA